MTPPSNGVGPKGKGEWVFIPSADSIKSPSDLEKILNDWGITTSNNKFLAKLLFTHRPGQKYDLDPDLIPKFLEFINENLEFDKKSRRVLFDMAPPFGEVLLYMGDFITIYLSLHNYECDLRKQVTPPVQLEHVIEGFWAFDLPNPDSEPSDET
jgi:hypothetical protein